MPDEKLMHRAFEIDVLACPRCGRRLRSMATVEDPREIREVLAGLARSAERHQIAGQIVDRRHRIELRARRRLRGRIGYWT